MLLSEAVGWLSPKLHDVVVLAMLVILTFGVAVGTTFAVLLLRFIRCTDEYMHVADRSICLLVKSSKEWKCNSIPPIGGGGPETVSYSNDESKKFGGPQPDSGDVPVAPARPPP